MMAGAEGKSREPQVISFASARAFRAWLARHHGKPEGIWLRIFRKDAGERTVTYQEALEEALCYGWIDGQKQSHDPRSFLQRFTPRRRGSLWSARNRQIAERLIASGRMRPPGLREFEIARRDGRLDAAYESSGEMEVPADFLQALRKDRKAWAFFRTLNRANTYAIAWRLRMARKPETRAKRFAALLAMLKDERKLH